VTDRRRVAWVIERCPKSKPAQKRIWSLALHIAYATRKEAMANIKGWIDPQYDKSLYRATMYVPAKASVEAVKGKK